MINFIVANVGCQKKFVVVKLVIIRKNSSSLGVKKIITLFGCPENLSHKFVLLRELMTQGILLSRERTTKTDGVGITIDISLRYFQAHGGMSTPVFAVVAAKYNDFLVGNLLVGNLPSLSRGEQHIALTSFCPNLVARAGR